MHVKVGDLYKHVNEDEPYHYKVVDVLHNNLWIEDRHLVIIILENSITDTLFKITGDKFVKYYECKTIYPICDTGLQEGENVRRFAYADKYICTKAWMWDIYCMAYELKDLETGELTTIDEDKDKKHYYSIPPAGLFTNEAYQHERCSTIITLLAKYRQITMESHDSLGKWLDQTSAYTIPLPDPEAFSGMKSELIIAIKNFGAHHRDIQAKGLYRLPSISAYEKFVKDIFYRLSIRYLCD